MRHSISVGYLLILLPLLVLLKLAPTAGHSLEGANRVDSNQWGVPHKISIVWLSVAGFFCCISWLSRWCI